MGRRGLAVSVLPLIAAAVATSVSVASPSACLPQVRDPVWSPDGSELAYVRWQGPPSGVVGCPYPVRGQMYVVGRDGSRARSITPLQTSPYGLTWSPDGRSLAYSTNGHIWRVDLDVGRPLRLTVETVSYDHHPAWSPDGSEIAYTEGPSSPAGPQAVLVVPAVGGPPRVLGRGVGGLPEWSPDGSDILVYGAIVHRDGSDAVMITGCAAQAWSLDGTELVGVAPHVCVVSASTGATVYEWLGESRFLTYASLSPRNTRVAVSTAAGKVLIVNRQTPDVSPVTLPRGDSGSDRPRWSPQGALAYVARGSCGPRSEIDVVRSDGSHMRKLAVAC